jgi:ankyrin repeat protein
MGCNASKTASAVRKSPKQQGKPTPQPAEGRSPVRVVSPPQSRQPPKADTPQISLETAQTGASRKSARSSRSSGKAADTILYKLLAKVAVQGAASDNASACNDSLAALSERILETCASQPRAAHYRNPTTHSTPLHMAVRLLDYPQAAGRNSNTHTSALPAVLQGLIRAFPDAVKVRDAAGHLPLHYAVAPNKAAGQLPAADWKVRAEVLQLLLAADIETSVAYLQQPAVHFDVLKRDQRVTTTAAATPFYRALQALPDDFSRGNVSPTVIFCAVLKEASPAMVTVANPVVNGGDGDTPLALLYRRFTRQFDLAEKFFSGDNSRPQVVQHRHRYKTAAGNTWKIMECLLRPEPALGQPAANVTWRLLHRAVQLETPPDLLRYIVETNAEDLQELDAGNLPLHYAAAATHRAHSSIYYSKFVTDELLYKYPEAAAVPNAAGRLPLAVAVEAHKAWIGGGLQSLYEAYPAALDQVDLEQHPALRKIFSDDAASSVGPSSPEEKKTDGPSPRSRRDEAHDAIMLVQQAQVPVTHVVNAMWAHEEDAGLQMLACVALARLVRQEQQLTHKGGDLMRIALPSVSAVVNAMKAHPNEVIVQEKASHVLGLLAVTDGQRELSFVASGAIAALVGALQAHVSDAAVQEEAASALAAIVQAGGADRATIVASVSGLTALVNALAAHPNVVGVQREACRALAVLLPHSQDANLPTLCRAQTEPLLQAAATQFPVECGPHVDALTPYL